MSQPSHSDYTHLLRSHMQQVGVLSLKALSRAAGVSERQINLLRQGKAAQMQAGTLHKLSQTLQIPLIDLLDTFSDLPVQRSPQATSPNENSAPALEVLQQEYERLQAQLVDQQDSIRRDMQRDSLQILESLLLQLPTAAHAAEQNPQIPAARLLPLLRPIDHLLKHWGIEAIAPVGSEVAFDPQRHQLMEGTAQPGDRVKVRYTGYCQGNKLLYRAKVSPIAKS